MAVTRRGQEDLMAATRGDKSGSQGHALPCRGRGRHSGALLHKHSVHRKSSACWGRRCGAVVTLLPVVPAPVSACSIECWLFWFCSILFF